MRRLWYFKKRAGTTPYSNAKSILIDGVDEYLNLGSSAYDFAMSDAFGISAWIKPTVMTPQINIFAKLQSGSGPGYTFNMTNYNYPSGGQLSTGNFDNSGKISYAITEGGPTPITQNAWNHVVMTRDGVDYNTIRFYFNGVSKLPTNKGYYPSQPTGTMSNSANCTIGGPDGSGNSPFTGGMDEVSVWNKYLSQSDVDALYNSGHPGDLSTHASVANLIGWWRCGDLDDSISQIKDRSGQNKHATPTNMESGDIVSDTP